MRDTSGDTIYWGGVFVLVLIAIGILARNSLCISTSGTTDQSALSLSDLSNLKVEGSTADADLLNLTYWNSVSRAYATSLAQLLPNTVIGFINSSSEWRGWVFQNIPSPPPWVSSGIGQYMDAQLVLLRGRALTSGNSTLAALMVKAYAASIAGYPLAALDLVSLNGLTALRIYLRTGSII